LAIETPVSIPRNSQEEVPSKKRDWRAFSPVKYVINVLINIRQNPMLYLMVLPGVIYFVVFKYGPMYGATVAFKDYRVVDGIAGSPWVGFEHFESIFRSYFFVNILSNTLIISSLKLVFGATAAILLALLLNELRVAWFKRVVQTITYLPHFLSWVVVSGVVLAVLSPADGLVNDAIRATGGKPINFLSEPDWFRQVLVGSEVWKSTGFKAIVYLAAMTGISPVLYEAAAVDGASRFQRILYITLPSIMPVIVLVLLIDIGYIMNAGFEQIFVLYNPTVYRVSDIIDTWVYRRGLESFDISVASAVGVFKGVVGLVLIVICNRLAKRFTGSGIW
jgi:putative aldouronate transport system permease protein